MIASTMMMIHSRFTKPADAWNKSHSTNRMTAATRSRWINSTYLLYLPIERAGPGGVRERWVSFLLTRIAMWLPTNRPQGSNHIHHAGRLCPAGARGGTTMRGIERVGADRLARLCIWADDYASDIRAE